MGESQMAQQRKILITGGSNGMGKGVARALAAADRDHEIILLCRSQTAGENTIREIFDECGNTHLSLVLCDLTRLRDVRGAIQEIFRKHGCLDAVFINAGLGYAAKREETEDGMDSHFQVNYLSQFMLSLNLLPLLEKSSLGGRIIFNATNYGSIFWDDMQMKTGWTHERGIFQAMAAKRMFSRRLHSLYDRIPDSSLSFIAYEIHKTVWSNQLNIIPWYMKAAATVVKMFGGFMTTEECGQEMLPLFVEDFTQSRERSGKLLSWKNGTYYEVSEAGEILDASARSRLWDVSSDLCHDPETARLAEDLVRRASAVDQSFSGGL